MMGSFYKHFEDRFRGSRELILERLKVYLPLAEPLRSLYPESGAIDLGCGRGEWLQLLKTNGFLAHGVDIDEGMLEEARACGLSVELGDALEYLKSLPDDSINIISGFHIAEHLPFATLQELVQESLRVLKPAGLLILETPNPENLAVASNNFYLDPTHIRPLPPMLLSFLPEHYGFARVTIFRLNESIANNSEMPLLSVINGASPDYSVIAQKKAKPALMNLFDSEFNKKHGISTEDLAMQFRQANNDKVKLDDQIRRLAQREQELIAQLLAAQQQADRQRSELEKRHIESSELLGQNLQEAHQELSRIAQEHEKREQLLTEKSNQTRQEMASLLRTLAQREQEVAAQLQAVRERAEEQRAALEDRHKKEAQIQRREHEEHERNLALQMQDMQQELRSLGQERVRREALLFGQADKARQELSALLRTLAQREQESSEEAQVQRREYEERERDLMLQLQGVQKELLSLRREYEERERDLALQLQGVQQDLHSLKQDWERREQVLIKDTNLAQQEAVSLLRAMAKREQEYSTQLSALHQQAQAEHKEIAHLQSHIQALQVEKSLQAHQHQFELRVKEDEKNRLMQVVAAVEHKIGAQVQSEQQNDLLFQQTLSDVQREIGKTSLVRRMMAPLLKPILVLAARTESAKSRKGAIVVTLEALLCYEDHQFVQQAYRAVLGREADPEGLDYYTGLLRDGISKKRILGMLRLSAEGKARAANIPGLDPAIQAYQWSRAPLFGKLIEWACTEDNSASERALRALENKLYRLAESDRVGYTRIESVLNELQQLRQHRAEDTAQVGMTPAEPAIVVDLLTLVPEPDIPKELPHHAGVIYLKLRKSISTASRNLALAKAGSDIRAQARTDVQVGSQLSTRARDVYIQLKEAAFIHARRSA